MTEISSAPALIPSHQPDVLVQINEYLFLSGSEAADNYEELTKNGVKYVINTATELRNSFEEYGISYMRLDLVDNPSQKLCQVKVFQSAFDFIGSSLLVPFLLYKNKNTKTHKNTQKHTKHTKTNKQTNKTK